MLTPAAWRPPRGYPLADARRARLLGVHADRASVLGVLSEVVTVGPVAGDQVAGGRARATPAETLTDGWRVRVTADDVRDAREAWLAARDGGAPADRVQDLRDDVDRLVRAVAQQGADDVRRFAVAPARPQERQLQR